MQQCVVFSNFTSFIFHELALDDGRAESWGANDLFMVFFFVRVFTNIQSTQPIVSVIYICCFFFLPIFIRICAVV